MRLPFLIGKDFQPDFPLVPLFAEKNEASLWVGNVLVYRSNLNPFYLRRSRNVSGCPTVN
jgi:hypothetical protein